MVRYVNSGQVCRWECIHRHHHRHHHHHRRRHRRRRCASAGAVAAATPSRCSHCSCRAIGAIASPFKLSPRGRCHFVGLRQVGDKNIWVDEIAVGTEDVSLESEQTEVTGQGPPYLHSCNSHVLLAFLDVTPSAPYVHRSPCPDGAEGPQGC